MLQVNETIRKAQIQAGKAIASDTVIASCLSTIERECKKFGVPGPLDWRGEVKDVPLRISDTRIFVTINASDANYNVIMANKNTSISSTEIINCQYDITQVLVDYGIDICITFSFDCPLPEEDLHTLRMLGKIHTEHSSYSSTSESVYCKI